MIQLRKVLPLLGALSLAACASANDVPSDGPEAATAEADMHSNHGNHGGHGGHNKPGEPYPTKDPKALKLREAHVREIYQNLVYPTPIGILTGATTVDHLFERDSVKGRVTPVGQFPDFGAVVEYFYALAVTPGSIVDGVKFRSLLSGDDQVSMAIDIHFCRSPDGVCDPNVPNSATSQTLTQVGFFRFNKQNRVISMDLNILNLGAASDPPNDPAVHAAAIGQLCTALTVAHIEPTTGAVVNSGTCTSYFDSADDFPAKFPLAASPFQNCMAFMQSIPYGSWDRANSNTVTCRQLHTILTAVDPDMHCPHTSADGGGACIDFSYASYYDESF
ncbi:MAG TPA: hypothetical protein VER96_37290 [Polyangiaceae bacterium]|nr:hypothetical protein [Polyangiaceae bacterium]